MRHGSILPNGEHHGTVVMHRCDNPACCNPAHLTLGSQRDNARDAAAKGRLAGGGGLQKLTQADVDAILEDPRPHSVIAKQFGVSKTHVGRLKKKAAAA
jgi:DNA invertase Pin-like site-specific DNA recombinase